MSEPLNACHHVCILDGMGNSFVVFSLAENCSISTRGERDMNTRWRITDMHIEISAIHLTTGQTTSYYKHFSKVTQDIAQDINQGSSVNWVINLLLLLLQQS